MDQNINAALDVILFLLCIGKVYYGHWTDFGSMTRIGVLLGSAWLVADDLDIFSLIPGDFSHYSLIRTGTFKLVIIVGLLLDILRLKLEKVAVNRYVSLVDWAKMQVKNEENGG